MLEILVSLYISGCENLLLCKKFHEQNKLQIGIKLSQSGILAQNSPYGYRNLQHIPDLLDCEEPPVDAVTAPWSLLSPCHQTGYQNNHQSHEQSRIIGSVPRSNLKYWQKNFPETIPETGYLIATR